MKAKSIALLTTLAFAIGCDADKSTHPVDEKPIQSKEVKWYPGHYLTLSHKDSRTAWQAIASQPGFAGGQRYYTWRQLEPERDHYDFSAIEMDLAFLHQQHQRLVLEVWDTTFLNHEIPVPDYLMADPVFKGGIARATENPAGARTKRWVPAVMDRYLHLVAALGKRFDPEPDFVGFVHTETAMESKGPGFEDFKGADYDAQMCRLVVNSRKAFPNTPVIVFGNWYPYRGKDGLKSLSLLAQTNGVGWGGPDLCPGTKVWGYDIIRANAGQMALGLSAQWQTYDGRWTAQQLLDSAIHDFKLNFVFWGNFDRRKNRGLSLTQDVIPAVNAYREPLATNRPANLKIKSIQGQ